VCVVSVKLILPLRQLRTGALYTITTDLDKEKLPKNR
jgi:hypothetical protein